MNKKLLILVSFCQHVIVVNIGQTSTQCMFYCLYRRRTMQSYGSECSPFVSSDNEAAMGMTFSSLSYPCASEQSIDDLLTESRPVTTTSNQHHPNQYTARAGSQSGSSDSSLLQHGGSLKIGLKHENWLSPSSADQVRLQAREQRIKRTNRRPSRLSSATDSNDESVSPEHQASQYSHSQYLTKPALFPSSSQADAEPVRKHSMHHIVPSSPAVRLMKRDLLSSIDDGDGGIGEDGEDEQRYCFCHDVSYGDMIACDAPNCPFEWFHYNCVGLLVAPKGQWFCSSCTKTGTAARFVARKRANNQSNIKR